jgi:protocatechuate 3,4-dioxygenase beta subunit
MLKRRNGPANTSMLQRRNIMSHAHGLVHDLPFLLKRRQLLRLAGLGAVATLATACDGGPPSNSEANVSGNSATGEVCLKTPVETNGPFPADGSNSSAGSLQNVLRDNNIIRTDIRPNLAPDTPMAEGEVLDISLTLVDVKNACQPLQQFLVYVWHCDAAGKYSIYELPESNYLRGVVVTDQQGMAQLRTIFPGCYSGRWPHIHFEVFKGWTSGLTLKDSLLVSQFALPETTCRQVYDGASYAGSAAALASTTMASDGIFGDNTPQQVAAQTLAISGNPGTGFKARVTIGLALT